MDLILLVYCLLIVLAVIRKKDSQQDYLSVEYTTNMRGIAALGIILHHMSERTHGGLFFSKLGIIGYLLVTFFFFLSGYGLMVQYEKKKESYLKGFMRKRVLYLTIVYLLDVLLYAVAGDLMGKNYTLWQVLKSIVLSGVAMNAWYMIVQILFYLSFFVLFRCRYLKTTLSKIWATFAFQALFCLWCILVGRSGMWYLSNFGFALGMFWAYYKERIDRVLCEKYIRILLLTVGSFAVFYFLPVVTDRLFQNTVAEWIRTVCRLLSSPLSAALLVVLSYKFRPRLPLWNWLGKISLEIYLIHGLVYSFLRSNFVQIESDFIWTVLTILISVLLAVFTNQLNGKIAAVLKHS